MLFSWLLLGLSRVPQLRSLQPPWVCRPPRRGSVPPSAPRPRAGPGHRSRSRPGPCLPSRPSDVSEALAPWPREKQLPGTQASGRRRGPAAAAGAEGGEAGRGRPVCSSPFRSPPFCAPLPLSPSLPWKAPGLASFPFVAQP